MDASGHVRIQVLVHARRIGRERALQIHHRISSPEALAWSESCRVLYRDFGLDYVTYALGQLSDRCFAFPARAA